MATKEKVFADGFICKELSENTPDWVKANISIKVDEAIAFLQKRSKNGWVNLVMKESQSGKTYLELDLWEPKVQIETAKGSAEEEDEDSLPF